MRDKITYIAQSFRASNNAGVKPTTDIESILKEGGARNIGVRSTITNLPKIAGICNYLSLKKALYTMPQDEIVFLHYPMQYGINELFDKAKERGNKIVICIHDLNELRDKQPNYPRILAEADVVIVHTKSMADYVQQKYNPNTIVLNIFDYIIEENPANESPRDDGYYEIVFAGNLLKASFLKKLKWKDGSKIILSLYGNGWSDNSSEQIHYKGSVNPIELPRVIADCHFGLVWDGDEISSCSGAFGEYLTVNAPYKASSYLSAGLPLIIWDKMGIKNFLLEKGAAIAISSLNDLPEVLGNMSDDEYNNLRRQARLLGMQIRTGYFTKEALRQARKMANA